MSAFKKIAIVAKTLAAHRNSVTLILDNLDALRQWFLRGGINSDFGVDGVVINAQIALALLDAVPLGPVVSSRTHADQVGRGLRIEGRWHAFPHVRSIYGLGAQMVLLQG